jgi:regulatory protein
MKAQNSSENCFAAALRILTQRDHSCSELSRKLIDRGFSQDQIKSAVSECLRLHYLDDERYADIYAHQLQRKGYGCCRIQQKLIAKGLASQVIASCLENYCQDKVQIQSCRQALHKKLKGNQAIEGSVEIKARLYRFLLSRGFSPAIIRQVMDDAFIQRE